MKSPISSPTVGAVRERRELFGRAGRIYAGDDPELDMPAELSERLQASDAALAARVACGEPAALSPLYERHRRAVYRFALLWAGSASVAADVTQEVFLHLLTHADDYEAARGPLQPWLLGIARNFVHKRAGADARYVANDEDGEPDAPDFAALAPDVALDAQRELTRLRAAIAALPPHYRDVLVLVELAERSYAEAAAICGCELNTVRSRLSRGRALIARWLDVERSAQGIAKGSP
jgi:RNA polymerase sigma-70 factor (ECF subfamily)